jgi:Uma2 family endonuclease
VIPDLAAYVPGEALPKLVVEYRAESTERYILGPKRLIYARAGIPEMWFVEPHAAHVLTLQEHRGLDYAWPAEEHRSGDVVVSRIFPGVALRVADLID